MIKQWTKDSFKEFAHHYIECPIVQFGDHYEARLSALRWRHEKVLYFPISLNEWAGLLPIKIVLK